VAIPWDKESEGTVVHAHDALEETEKAEGIRKRKTSLRPGRPTRLRHPPEDLSAHVVEALKRHPGHLRTLQKYLAAHALRAPCLLLREPPPTGTLRKDPPSPLSLVPAAGLAEVARLLVESFIPETVCCARHANLRQHAVRRTWE
jgi:hypothetical protein